MFLCGCGSEEYVTDSGSVTKTQKELILFANRTDERESQYLEDQENPSRLEFEASVVFWDEKTEYVRVKNTKGQYGVVFFRENIVISEKETKSLINGPITYLSGVGYDRIYNHVVSHGVELDVVFNTHVPLDLNEFNSITNHGSNTLASEVVSFYKNYRCFDRVVYVLSKHASYQKEMLRNNCIINDRPIDKRDD